MSSVVYLAGKVSHGNAWRKLIVPNIRDRVSSGSAYYEMILFTPTIFKDIKTSGPYFISCDHGCYHGENTHGVGANKKTCDGGYTPPEIVARICREQIKKSDFVFAYIDTNDCYGTLCEIGYAIGLKKYVAVMFSDDDLMKQMWFVSEMADAVFDKYGLTEDLKSSIVPLSIYDKMVKIANVLAKEEEG